MQNSLISILMSCLKWMCLNFYFYKITHKKEVYVYIKIFFDICFQVFFNNFISCLLTVLIINRTYINCIVILIYIYIYFIWFILLSFTHFQWELIFEVTCISQLLPAFSLDKIIWLFFFWVNWLLSDFYICISWAKKLLPLLYYHVMSGTKKHATHKNLLFFFFFLFLLFFYHSFWADENSWVECRGDFVIFFYVVGFYFRFSYASSVSVSVISSAVFSSCLTRRTTVYWLCRQHPRNEQLGTASKLGDKATKSHRNPLTVLKRAKPRRATEWKSLSLSRFALSVSLQSADGDEGFNCRCYWPSNRFSSLFVVAAAKSKNNNKNKSKRGLSYFLIPCKWWMGKKLAIEEIAELHLV